MAIVLAIFFLAASRATPQRETRIDLHFCEASSCQARSFIMRTSTLATVWFRRISDREALARDRAKVGAVNAA